MRNIIRFSIFGMKIQHLLIRGENPHVVHTETHKRGSGVWWKAQTTEQPIERWWKDMKWMWRGRIEGWENAEEGMEIRQEGETQALGGSFCCVRTERSLVEGSVQWLVRGFVKTTQTPARSASSFLQHTAKATTLRCQTEIPPYRQREALVHWEPEG